MKKRYRLWRCWDNKKPQLAKEAEGKETLIYMAKEDMPILCPANKLYFDDIPEDREKIKTESDIYFLIKEVKNHSKQELKDISLEIWDHLIKHPKIKRKEDLPSHLYDKIKWFRFQCPMCEMFQREDPIVFASCYDKEGTGKICPLKHCSANSWYYHWFNAPDEKRRAYCATQIYNKIDAWVIDN